MDDKVKDIGLLRRRRRRRRRILKMTAFLILIFIGTGLYMNREKWIPELEGIGARYHVISQSRKSKETGSSFPLNIQNGVNYYLGNLDKYLAILSDAYLHIYSQNGTLIETRQHAYSNPVMQTVGKKVLIYEHGSNRFRVDNKYHQIYEKTVDENILFARLSKDGYVAVVSSSDTYVCILTIFDDSGKEIYKVSTVDRIFDLSFNDDSTGCITISMDAIDGSLVSKASYLKFNSETEKWSTENFDASVVKSYYTSEDGVFIVGDTKCAYFDNTGVKISEYVYSDELAGYSFYDGKVALIMKNSQKRQSKLVTIKGPNAEAVETDIDDELKAVYVDENYAYVLMSKNLISYNFSGESVKKFDISNTYDDFYKIGNYFFLMGYDRIDRLDYRG